MCISVCEYVCVSTGTHGGQKQMWDALRLELQAMGAGY